MSTATDSSSHCRLLPTPRWKGAPPYGCATDVSRAVAGRAARAAVREAWARRRRQGAKATRHLPEKVSRTTTGAVDHAPAPVVLVELRRPVGEASQLGLCPSHLQRGQKHPPGGEAEAGRCNRERAAPSVRSASEHGTSRGRMLCHLGPFARATTCASVMKEPSTCARSGQLVGGGRGGRVGEGRLGGGGFRGRSASSLPLCRRKEASSVRTLTDSPGAEKKA